jgi:hypothetical protein
MFRETKDTLETRPVFHKCDSTILGHVFVIDDDTYLLSSPLQGVCGKVFKAAGVAIPPSARKR